MATDMQLSRNFWLRWVPCWWVAEPADVAKLQETTARVLQPLRNKFGPVFVSSWKWWATGCAPRTGSHGQGGTVDLEVSGGQTLAAWEWGNTYLMPSGYIGRWIYEPETESQGEHIHVAPRADMIAYNGDGRIQSLKELPDGTTYVFQEWTAGTFVNPYRLEPITAVARAGMPWWLGLGILSLLWTFDLSTQATGGWKLKGS